MATCFPAGWAFLHYYCELCNQTSFSVDIQYICVQFVTGTGFLGKWLQHQVCRSSRSIWTMISVMWLIVRSSCVEQGVGLGDPYEFCDSVWGEEGFRAKEMLDFWLCCSVRATFHPTAIRSKHLFRNSNLLLFIFFYFLARQQSWPSVRKPKHKSICFAP